MIALRLGGIRSELGLVVQDARSSVQCRGLVEDVEATEGLKVVGSISRTR